MQKSRHRTKGEEKTLYSNQVAASFRNGIAQPFIPYYARRLGATEIDLGWMTALQNLFPNALQIPWGRLSDRLGRRTPFIFVGMTLTAIAYLMIIASSTVMLVILAVLFQAVATSAVIPAWSALLGEKIPETTRGTTFGRMNLWAGVAAIVGGLIATFLLFTAAPESSTAYHLPFLVALFAGLIAAGTIRHLKEPHVKEVKIMGNGGSIKENLDDAKHKDFIYFTKVQMFYNFFKSLIWPIMYFTTVDVLGATNVEIAILALCSSLATVAVQSQVGRLLDRVGPVSLINISRFSLVFVPLIYGFATSIYFLYFLNILLGASIAIINIAYTAYILDIAPKRHKGESFAIYNTGIGIVTFVGSLVGGYLATVFIGITGSLWLGLLVVYLISFSGRLSGAVMSLKIRDPRIYPERITDVMHGYLVQLRSAAMRLSFFKPH